MNQKELKELIEFLIEKDIAEFELERGDVKVQFELGNVLFDEELEKDIAEFELERGDVKVRIKRAGEHTFVHSQAEPRFYAVPAAPALAPELGGGPVRAAPVAAAAPPAAPAPEEGLHMVKSPIVGTFYEAPSPGAP